MWWDLQFHPAYEVPKDSGVSALWAGALWIAGYDDQGNLKVAAQTYRQSGNDFFPGPLDETGNVLPSACSYFDRIWKVNKSTIDSFNLGLFPAVPNSILEWPGRGNPNLSFLPDQDLAPFIDVDGDEQYHPDQGDYPAIQGDQALWYVFNDKGNDHTVTDGEPLGIEIKCMAYSSTSPACVYNTTFYHYTVINKSGGELKDFYFGLWTDPHLGCWLDDLIACDTTRNMAIIYNDDTTDDESCSENYGNTPPYIGIRFLKTPDDSSGNELGLTNFIHFKSEATVNGTPETPEDFANYLKSIWKDGTHLTYGGNGYGGSQPINYAFPSEPNDTAGWSECPWDVAVDYRVVLSSGPFTLANASSESFDLAAIWTPLPEGSYPCPSLDSLRNDADCVQEVFNNFLFVSASTNNSYKSQIIIFPNPASTTIHLQLPSTPTTITLFSLLGEKVREEKVSLPAGQAGGGEITIDVNELPAGLYFVRTEETTVGKFVKE